MKKERNSFFQSAEMTTQATINPMMPMQQSMMQQPMMQQPMMQQPMMQQPMMQVPATSQNSPSYYNNNEIENLERAINNLDARVTKLENQINGNNKDYSTNMHMV